MNYKFLKALFTISAGFILLSCGNDNKSKNNEKNIECKGSAFPYWGNSNNLRTEGESKKIRKIFSDIQLSKKSITPNNGFITLRLIIDESGNVCRVESFQIDENYKATVFNENKLIERLEKRAKSIGNWSSEFQVMSYYLIRMNIKNGAIYEIY